MAEARALTRIDELEEAAIRRERGLWSDAFRRLIRNRLAMLSLVVLAVVLVVSLLGNYVDAVQRYEPHEQNYSEGTKLPPSWDHFFGTDNLGRDTWARVLEGTWISLRVGIGVAIAIFIIGVLIGGAAALTGPIGDNILMRFTDLTYAFPDLLFIILLRAVLFGKDIPGGELVLIIFAIAMVSWTTVARLVRGQMLSLKERDYVVAARTMGATQARIVFVHMLPNALGPVIVAITFAIPLAIFAEAVLAFIGFGLEPPTASLGTLIDEGYRQMIQTKWMLVFPACALALLMLCFTFLGDGLRDALDPRSR
jgi:oligopeptide transport system permease protein